MTAIKEAKQELLKHSLDLMVSTNLIEEEDATRLYKMTEQPYSLVDSVIDTYAQNKDVGEFMKSLKLLATFVSGELDHLLDKTDEELEEMKTGAPLGKLGSVGTGTSPKSPSVATTAVPPVPPSSYTSKSKFSTTATPANTPAGKYNPPLPPFEVNSSSKRKPATTTSSTSTSTDINLLKSQQVELSQIILELNKAKVCVCDDIYNYKI